jgi:superfamily I DNA/RNA helicase
LENTKDQSALLRIINYPRRGIGEKALAVMTQYNREHGLSLWSVIEGIAKNTLTLDISTKSAQSIRDFYQLIKEAQSLFSSHSLPEACEKFIHLLGYESVLQEESSNKRIFEMKRENVGEIIAALEEYSQSSPDGNLAEFLSQSILQEEKSELFKRTNLHENCFQLLTFHSAKGLEFPACFLVGVEDHIIPHERSMKDTGVDEERRLMYVAITRAKRFLTISMAQKRKRMGKDALSKPSRFLFEIPKELLEPRRWDDV